MNANKDYVGHYKNSPIMNKLYDGCKGAYLFRGNSNRAELVFQKVVVPVTEFGILFFNAETGRRWCLESSSTLESPYLLLFDKESGVLRCSLFEDFHEFACCSNDQLYAYFELSLKASFHVVAVNLGYTAGSGEGNIISTGAPEMIEHIKWAYSMARRGVNDNES